MTNHGYVIFAVFNAGRAMLYSEFELLPDSFIRLGNGPATPIEDFGDFMFFKEEVTEDEAFDAFLEMALWDSVKGCPE